MKIKKKHIILISCIAAALLLAAGLLFLVYRLAFDPYRGTVNDFAISEDLDKTLTSKEAPRRE